MGLSDEKTMLLTTFKRDGSAVSVPVWLVPMGNGEFGFWTSSKSGKVKRLAHTPRVTVQASNGMGKIKDGAPVIEGTGRVVSGAEYEAITAKVKAKYGFATKFTKVLATVTWRLQGKPKPYGDVGVIVSLPADAG